MSATDHSDDAAYFARAVTRHCDAYVAHFGSRLRAVYVWGSVHRGEAVRGVSDLDLQVFTADAPTPDDLAWLQSTRQSLDRECPGCNGLQRPFPESTLLVNPDADAHAQAIARALAFRCRYDATLARGQDIAAQASAPPT